MQRSKLPEGLLSVSDLGVSRLDLRVHFRDLGGQLIRKVLNFTPKLVRFSSPLAGMFARGAREGQILSATRGASKWLRKDRS